jgi:hypothetical protein
MPKEMVLINTISKEIFLINKIQYYHFNNQYYYYYNLMEWNLERF